MNRCRSSPTNNSNNSNSGVSQALGGTGLGTASIGGTGGLAFRLNNGGMIAETDFNNKVSSHLPNSHHHRVYHHNPEACLGAPHGPRHRHQHLSYSLPEAFRARCGEAGCCGCCGGHQQSNGRVPNRCSSSRAAKEQQQHLQDVSSILAALVCVQGPVNISLDRVLK